MMTMCLVVSFIKWILCVYVVTPQVKTRSTYLQKFFDHG